MATDPAFSSTINNGTALLGSAATNLQAADNISTIITAGASGTKIEEIVVEASNTTLTATTVAVLVYIFLHDGSTYHLFDTFTISAVTASSTAAPFRASKTYLNLIIKTGWSVRASQSVSGNASLLKCHVFGADL